MIAKYVNYSLIDVCYSLLTGYRNVFRALKYYPNTQILAEYQDVSYLPKYCPVTILIAEYQMLARYQYFGSVNYILSAVCQSTKMFAR